MKDEIIFQMSTNGKKWQDIKTYKSIGDAEDKALGCIDGIPQRIIKRKYYKDGKLLSEVMVRSLYVVESIPAVDW